MPKRLNCTTSISTAALAFVLIASLLPSSGQAVENPMPSRSENAPATTGPKRIENPMPKRTKKKVAPTTETRKRKYVRPKPGTQQETFQFYDTAAKFFDGVQENLKKITSPEALAPLGFTLTLTSPVATKTVGCDLEGKLDVLITELKDRKIAEFEEAEKLETMALSPIEGEVLYHGTVEGTGVWLVGLTADGEAADRSGYIQTGKDTSEDSLHVGFTLDGQEGSKDLFTLTGSVTPSLGADQQALGGKTRTLSKVELQFQVGFQDRKSDKEICLMRVTAQSAEMKFEGEEIDPNKKKEDEKKKKEEEKKKEDEKTPAVDDAKTGSPAAALEGPKASKAAGGKNSCSASADDLWLILLASMFPLYLGRRREAARIDHS